MHDSSFASLINLRFEQSIPAVRGEFLVKPGVISRFNQTIFFLLTF